MPLNDEVTPDQDMIAAEARARTRPLDAGLAASRLLPRAAARLPGRVETAIATPGTL